MVVSAALVIVLIGMVLFRIEESADRPRMPRGAWVVPADAPLTG